MQQVQRPVRADAATGIGIADCPVRHAKVGDVQGPGPDMIDRAAGAVRIDGERVIGRAEQAEDILFDDELALRERYRAT